MTRYRLRIQQFALTIRSTLHTKIIANNQRNKPTAAPNYSGHS
ncbi:MAG: hypothetical protein QOD10_4607 [Mycobacterium sp.]|jgi:hypothetical protein|nr:hypothetical protein [Mycobacterium sp.]